LQQIITTWAENKIYECGNKDYFSLEIILGGTLQRNINF